MAQKTMMLNELTQYMCDCDLNCKTLNLFDFELLASFIETMFKSNLKESVQVKFKKHNLFLNIKLASIYIIENRNSKKNIIVFYKNGRIEIPKSVTQKQSEIAKTSFMKWCDFLYFENAGGQNYEY